MKAIVWQGSDHFEVHQVPDPLPGPGQVLVKVEAAAVCGSDSHLADFGAVPPLVPGHEAAGTIVGVGRGVSESLVGLRVALDPVGRCGVCWCCRNGIGHLCTHCRHLGDKQIAGAWAEYVCPFDEPHLQSAAGACQDWAIAMKETANGQRAAA